MGKKKSSTSASTSTSSWSSHNNNETPPKRRPASPSPPPPPPGTPPPALPSLMNSRMRIMSRDRGREKEARYVSNTINAASKDASSVSRSPSPNPNGTSNHFTTSNSQLLREWSSGGTANQFPDFLQPIPRGTTTAKPLFKDDTFISSMKAPTKKKRGSFIRRSMSLGNSSNNTVKSEGALDHRDMSSLFHVCFAVDDELVQIREFDKIDADYKPLLWYTAKELRHCMAQEVDWNRRYEDGDVDDDDMAAYMAAPNLDDFVCWRGLEHVYEGEDRAARIRKVIVGIVGWYRDAKEMGYHDPDELRVVAKARTKADRTKAQKRGAQDAKFIKEMIKNNNNNATTTTTASSGGMSFQSTSSGSSPKKMARRISGKITSSLLPTLNWSPKPNKKEKAIAVA